MKSKLTIRDDLPFGFGIGLIVARLHELVAKSIQAPETRDKLASLGANGVVTSPEEFLAFWRAESERWGKLIRTVGIKLE